MVTTRTLEHRSTRDGRAARDVRRVRAGAAPMRPAPRRRRRMRHDALERAGILAAQRLRAADSRHVRVYLGVTVAVAVLVAYLVLAAQVTQASYDLARLQNRQAELQAEQGQLRLREADIHTPAQVEHDAQQAGLQRQAPRGFATYQASGLSLDEPIGQPAAADRPLWQEAVASALGAVTGTRDAFAGDR